MVIQRPRTHVHEQVLQVLPLGLPAFPSLTVVTSVHDVLLDTGWSGEVDSPDILGDLGRDSDPSIRTG